MTHKRANIPLTVAVSVIAIIALLQPAELIQGQPTENHRIARPMYVSQFGSYGFTGYTPSQIRNAYNLPATGGAGFTIAIIDAYHTPSIFDDLTAFSMKYNLPLPNTTNFEVHRMSSLTGTDETWGQETCLDVEWAHAIAPQARILLVEAESPYTDDLLSAVSWATAQPGVVAVSMSWGTTEQEFTQSGLATFDSYFSVPGITFFSSSGDKGSEVNWPACSPNVVSVGGTTLNLDANDTVTSEIGWSGSGGGISTLVTIPAYQMNFGLNTSSRAVPDVSYNADPNTGFAFCYNAQWGIVGGTSAGAPQWAAIHALGLSASNVNLYQKSKSAYSTYFRDITLGSNGQHNAAAGYDCVTGLGSPSTFNFSASLEASPTSGPPGGELTLSGMGFDGNSTNISYFNPINASWVSLVNNLTVTTGNFTYPVNATDLLQSNPAGSNPQGSDIIVFSAIDNSNGKRYDATYTEFRRGLTQVGNAPTQGLYGNNTSLATAVLVQSNDTLPVAGNWFSPGTANLFWDNQNVGSTTIDVTGSFNTSLTVPPTTAGQHTLIISDGAVNFCVNITREPYTANDYVDRWHSEDFTVNLQSNWPISEVFYRINGGEVYNITAHGEPKIADEGTANTLEYWSTWNTIEATLNESRHVTLSGIRLDKTAPSGTISTNSVATSTNIVLSLSAADATSGVAQMRFSNDGYTWSSWVAYQTTAPWTLSQGDGAKTVYVQFSDNAGLTSTYSCSVKLQTPQPMLTPQAVKVPTATPTTIPTAAPTAQQFTVTEPSPTPAVPELSFLMVSILMSLSAVLAVFILKNRKKVPL